MKEVSLNFGAVKDTILRFSGKELLSEDKTKKVTIVNQFLKSLKDNPTLKIQHLVFRNLEEGYFNKERLAERYIKQSLKLLENASWNKILDSNRDLRIKLLENCHVEGAKGKEQLYENIHTLIESATRKGFNDDEKYNEAFDFILEHLTKEKPSNEQGSKTIEENDSPKFLSWNFITNLAVNNFNERYSHLNEGERGVLTMLLSSDDKKTNYLYSLQNESSQLIDKTLLECTDKNIENILREFKERLNILDTTTNIDEAIINCAELKESLMDLNK